jgi:hypothetical protein
MSDKHNVRGNGNPWDKRLGFQDDIIDEKLVAHASQDIKEEEDRVVEAAFDAQQVIEAAKGSLDFLAALAMPTVFRYFFPDLYKTAWNWLLTYVHKERDFSQLALGLPRGFAKTTFVKLFLLYVILFTKRNFILVCANSSKKAEAIVADVIDFLNETNILATFGDWKMGIENDRNDFKKFGFRGRNITIVAGTVETVRGLNVKHQRPDIMIFDDIQSRMDADSEVISMQIETDLQGTAMKAKSPHGCMFLFIGNMYPTKWSLLRRIKSNPTWLKFIAGGINYKGESLWEELQPLTQLLKEFENDLASGRPEVFYAEVLNDETASINNFVDINKIPKNVYEQDNQHQGNFIIIDPSNDKANSDNVSIGYFEIFDEKPVCKEVIEGRLSPGETITTALTLALRKGCRVICVESTAYQYSMLYWFSKIIAEYGLADAGFHCLEVYSGQRSKNSRILDMFKSVVKGEIILAEAVRPAVINQIVSFNPMKTNNVDGLLDLLTYAPKVIELYGPFILSSLTLEEQEFQSIPVRSALETSSF